MCVLDESGDVQWLPRGFASETRGCPVLWFVDGIIAV